MRLRFLSTKGRVFTAVLALLLFPLLVAATPKLCVTESPTPESYTWNFRLEATELLDESASRASQVQSHAAKLRSFTRQLNQPSWETHAVELNQVREQVNAIGEDLCRMHTIRHVTLPWQQQAIDSLTPQVVALAHQTEAAIHFLDENRQNLVHPTYKVYLDTIHEEAKSLRQSGNNAIEFAGGFDPINGSQRSAEMAANFCGF